jgi:hypothetical protein
MFDCHIYDNIEVTIGSCIFSVEAASLKNHSHVTVGFLMDVVVGNQFENTSSLPDAFCG